MPNHHVLRGDRSVVHLGGGHYSKKNVSMISTVAGTGTAGRSGDGGPASEAMISRPASVVFDAAGNMYVACQYDAETNTQPSVRKIDTDGNISTVPGLSGKLVTPCGMDIDSGGGLYIADGRANRLWRVGADGSVAAAAGNGEDGPVEDNVPATETSVSPTGVAVDTHGNIYIAEEQRGLVRKIDPSGRITTVAGCGTDGRDAIPAADSHGLSPFGITCDDAGNIYFSDDNRIRKIDTSGTITTVAGHSNIHGYANDGQRANLAGLSASYGIAFDSAGNFYISSVYEGGTNGGGRIRRVDPAGFIETVAGTGDPGHSGDNGAATRARMTHPRVLAVDREGNVFVPDYENHVVRKIGTGGVSTGEFTFADDNGLGYVFSETDLHERTVDLETGKTLLIFEYDSEDRIVGITDRFGQTTSVRRDAGGVPYEIVSPEGVVTGLTVDEHNQLRFVTYPDSTFYEFQYDCNDGLLTDKIEPKGNRFEHFFDDTGRVDFTTDDGGGRWTFAMTEDTETDETVYTTTSAEGQVTTYRDYTKPTGEYRSIITDPTGNRATFTKSADKLRVEREESCGMNRVVNYDLDPRFGYKYAKDASVSSPNGLTLNVSHQKSYENSDADPEPDIITETVTVNGKTTTTVHDVDSARITTSTPENRTSEIEYDPDTLLAKRVSVPELFDTNYTWYADGRAETVTTGTRQTVFTYDALGHPDTVTEDGIVTDCDYDEMGRLRWLHAPDSPPVYFDYDANGNMRMIRLNRYGSDTDHVFGHDGVNLNDGYSTPLSGNYVYDYDADRRLTRVTPPSGVENAIFYDYADGRLDTVRTPEGDIDYEYACGTKVSAISHLTSLESLSFTYDGDLPLSETFGGTLENHRLEFTYDNDFHLVSFTYAGVTDTFAYDDDGLLTNAGSYTVDRRPSNGLPDSVTGNELAISRGFNGHGEVESQNFSINGITVASWSVVRDNNGRITNKTETADAITSEFVYNYDDAGRLLTVTKDGTVVEEYGYSDPNSGLPAGIRTYERKGAVERRYTYSDEDHLTLIDDGTSFTYCPDGFLETKTTVDGTATYDYSSRGELLSATLPDNRIVSYVHDPIGRRIAKKIDGVVVEKYLWNGRTQLLAVFNADDSLKMRFEYADARMPASMEMGGLRYYLAYDQVGSLRIVADSTGNVVKRIEYDSFGNIIGDSDPLFEIPFGFAGGLHERHTGLVRFGFRDYDPDVGRWTAKDPIGFAGGDTDLFGYCWNDPINFVDPTGQFGGAFIGFAAGMVAATAIAYVGSKLAAEFVNDEASAAVDDAMAKVAEINASQVASAAVGEAAGATLGAALRMSRCAPKTGQKLLPPPKTRGNPNPVGDKGPFRVTLEGQAVPPIDKFNPGSLIKHPRVGKHGKVNYGTQDPMTGKFKERVAVHPREPGKGPKTHGGQDHYHFNGNKKPIFAP